MALNYTKDSKLNFDKKTLLIKTEKIIKLKQDL